MTQKMDGKAGRFPHESGMILREFSNAEVEFLRAEVKRILAEGAMEPERLKALKNEEASLFSRP